MDSRLRINIHTYILFFCKYIYTIHRKHPDSIETNMFMHTNVCTLWESNLRPLVLSSIRVIAPIGRENKRAQLADNARAVR
jgi:hypothetical protein